MEAVHDEEPPPLLPPPELELPPDEDWPSLPIERSVASRWLWAEERDTRVFPVFWTRVISCVSFMVFVSSDVCIAL